jgi:hypothetical protein
MLKLADLKWHRGRRRQVVTRLRKFYFETASTPTQMLRTHGTTSVKD